MAKETLQTGKPLELWEIVDLTGKDALADMDGRKCRIMNYSEGQSIEVDDSLMWGGHFWGLKRVAPRDGRYDYFAFIAVM